jgi:hypothetical protein
MAPKKRQQMNPNDTICRTSPRTRSTPQKKQKQRGHSKDGSSKKVARKPECISYHTSDSNENVARKGKDLSQQFSTSHHDYGDGNVFGAKLKNNNDGSSEEEDDDDEDYELFNKIQQEKDNETEEE